MKLLGWMHRKLRQNNSEPQREFAFGHRICEKTRWHISFDSSCRKFSICGSSISNGLNLTCLHFLDVTVVAERRKNGTGCYTERWKTLHVRLNWHFFAWSLLDNIKWRLGYTSKFSIVYIDFKTLKCNQKYLQSIFFLLGLFCLSL